MSRGPRAVDHRAGLQHVGTSSPIVESTSQLPGPRGRRSAAGRRVSVSRALRVEGTAGRGSSGRLAARRDQHVDRVEGLACRKDRGGGSSGRLAARRDQLADRGVNQPASRATRLPTALPACRPGPRGRRSAAGRRVSVSRALRVEGTAGRGSSGRLAARGDQHADRVEGLACRKDRGGGSSGRLAARGDQHVDRGANQPGPGHQVAHHVAHRVAGVSPWWHAAVDHRAGLQHVGTSTSIVSRALRVERTAAVDHRAGLQHVGTSSPIVESTSQLPGPPGCPPRCRRVALVHVAVDRPPAAG